MCDCGNNCANECVIPITIPQGDQGPQGDPGPQGPQGDPGADGANAMMFEHFGSSNLDFLWPGGSPVVIPGMSHAVTQGAGDYMVIADILTQLDNDALGVITIYVDAVAVDTITPISFDLGADPPNRLTLPLSLNWKGTLTAGQTIEIRVNDAGSSGGALNSQKFQWQIYKVS
jgi:hypothetical protein